MSRQPVTVRLDPRRLEQLKAVALAEGSTVTEIITQIIRQKVANGVIAADIPGVVIKDHPNGLILDIGNGKPNVMAVADVRKLVASIREVVKGGSSIVSLYHSYAVLRQGSGIKIAAPFPGPEVPFPPSLADDFADLLEAAAK
jgi:hypothetical protein